MTSILRDELKYFILSNNLLKETMSRLSISIDKGLNKRTQSKSTVKCYPTFIQDLPSGQEKGKYLALDFGGSIFRVLIIDLDEHNLQMASKTYDISDDIRMGSVEQLFDYIAQCLDNFVKEKGAQDEYLPLGITLSFPYKQVGFTTGILNYWMKSVNKLNHDVLDIVQLFERAVKRRSNLNIKSTVLLNDTVGCLMSCAWSNSNCRIGVVVGKGCNGCYFEKSEKVSTFDNESGKPYVVINTEWGAFGEDGTLDNIQTMFDRQLDDASVHPGEYTFEKMISGIYLGELVRIIMEKLTEKGLLFHGKYSNILRVQGSFPSELLIEIESEPTGQYTNGMKILNRKGLLHATTEDCLNVNFICKLVSTRSAHLVATAIACLVNRMNFQNITVGMDGFLCRHHPHYPNLVKEKIDEIIQKGKTVDLILSEDGSFRGTALVTAVVEAAPTIFKETDKEEDQEVNENSVFEYISLF